MESRTVIPVGAGVVARRLLVALALFLYALNPHMAPPTHANVDHDAVLFVGGDGGNPAHAHDCGPTPQCSPALPLVHGHWQGLDGPTHVTRIEQDAWHDLSSPGPEAPVPILIG